jgi:hypothetical protein
MPNGHQTVIPSFGRVAGWPIVVICLDGRFLNFGVNTRLVNRLSPGEREQVLATVAEILVVKT